jgi:transcriptional regulator with XRE-family HTH domain
VAALPGMLEHDRKQAGWSVGRAAWELGIGIREYRELEAGTSFPDWETLDRLCKLFGWPRPSAERQVLTTGLRGV